jgi:hypothetical protein
MLVLAVASISSAENRIESSFLSFICGNSTINTAYPTNASIAVYAPAGSWLELDLVTNSSATTNQVKVERLLDWSTVAVKNVGTAPDSYYYANGNSTDDGYLDVSEVSNVRWTSIWSDNSTGDGTGNTFYAAANGAATAPQTFFVPAGGWYRVRVTGWDAGDYADDMSANSTKATLRVRKS